MKVNQYIKKMIAYREAMIKWGALLAERQKKVKKIILESFNSSNNSKML